jgi:hypothetical protein
MSLPNWSCLACGQSIYVTGDAGALGTGVPEGVEEIAGDAGLLKAGSSEGGEETASPRSPPTRPLEDPGVSSPSKLMNSLGRLLLLGLAVVCGVGAVAAGLGGLIFFFAANGNVARQCSGNGTCEFLSKGGHGAIIGFVLACGLVAAAVGAVGLRARLSR